MIQNPNDEELQEEANLPIQSNASMHWFIRSFQFPSSLWSYVSHADIYFIKYLNARRLPGRWGTADDAPEVHPQSPQFEVSLRLLGHTSLHQPEVYHQCSFLLQRGMLQLPEKSWILPEHQVEGSNWAAARHSRGREELHNETIRDWRCHYQGPAEE